MLGNLQPRRDEGERLIDKQERPKWQIYLSVCAMGFVVVTAIGLIAGDPIGEAVVAGLFRGLIFGVVMAFVLIRMTKVNRTYDELEKKHRRGDENTER